MKVSIRPDSVTFEDLQKKLETQFSGYKFSKRSNNFLVASKSSTIGANILLKKDKILVLGNFPSMGLQLLFTLSVVLLGFLIPIIIYFVAFNGKFKALEKELGEYLQNQYGLPKT